MRYGPVSKVAYVRGPPTFNSLSAVLGLVVEPNVPNPNVLPYLKQFRLDTRSGQALNDNHHLQKNH